MDTLTTIFFIILPFLLLYFLINAQTISPLPGPAFREYLPGGYVYPIMEDPRKMSRTVFSLGRKYGQVFQMWFGFQHVLCTACPQDITQIMANTSEFERPDSANHVLDAVAPGSIFTMPKAIHFVTKRHLRDRFNYSLLDSFHDQMTAAVQELSDNLSAEIATSSGEQSDIVNISQHLSLAAFRIITNVAFGSSLNKEDRLWLGSRTDIFLDEMLKDFIGYPFRQALSFLGIRKRLFSARDDVRSYCDNILTERKAETPEQRQSRTPDMLDAITTMDEQSHAEMASNILAFSAAGFHTTASATAWAIYEISCNPSVAAKVEKEVDAMCAEKNPTDPILHEEVDGFTYLKNVFKETLRLHPAAGFIMRKGAKDSVLRGSGVQLKKGTHVLALALNVHRGDEWTSPDSFMPERWGPGLDEGKKVPPGAYFPFSMGPRNCAGQFLAEYEAVLLLAELYRKFQFSLACKPEDVVSCSGWVESARSASVPGGELDFGIPVRVRLRSVE